MVPSFWVRNTATLNVIGITFSGDQTTSHTGSIIALDSVTSKTFLKNCIEQTESMPNTTSIFSSANISPRPTFTFFWWLFPIHNDILLQFKKNNPPTEIIEPGTSQPLQVREPSELKRNSHQVQIQTAPQTIPQTMTKNQQKMNKTTKKIDFKENN